MKLLIFLFLISSVHIFAIKESDCYKYWDCINKRGLTQCKPDCNQKNKKCLHEVNTCHKCYKKVEGDSSPFYCDIMQDSRKHSAHLQDPR